VERESTYYSVDEAAALLQLPPARVWEMLIAGELESIPPGATLERAWKVRLPTAAHRKQTAPIDQPPASRPEEQEESRAADEGAESLVEPPSERADAGDESSENASERSPRVRRAEARGGEVAADIARDLLLRVQELQYKLGRTEARAELTERAESTLREDLERERVERLEVQRRVEQARSTLEEERRRREAAERERDELRCRLADVAEPPPDELPSEPREDAATPTTLQPGRVGPQAAALEGAQKPSDAVQTPAATSEREAKPRPSTWSTGEGTERRPWWRRLLGGMRLSSCSYPTKERR
jgi:hypothetical protein